MKTTLFARLAGLFLILFAAAACDDAHHDKLVLDDETAGTDEVTPPTCSMSDNKCVSSAKIVDGVCTFEYLMCNDNNVCTEDTCNPKTGKCESKDINFDYDCDDGNPCTVGDYCKSGACTGAASKNCDDGDECTIDKCSKSGACSNEKIAGCVPSPPDLCQGKNCDDNNPCTTDTCQAGACVHAFNSNPCGDGDPCTVGDLCVAGYCKGGAMKDCYDGNPCTSDACTSGICKHEPAPGGWTCDDGNPNTVNDKCWGTNCAGTVPASCSCNDNNACTLDTCSGNNQCQYTQTVCNDSNPCTTDSCSPSTGCVYTAITGCGAPQCTANTACNDNNACTQDSCINGVCQFSPIAGCGSEMITVSVKCDGSCEPHIYFGNAGTDKFGAAVGGNWFAITETKAQWCKWGMEIKPRVHSSINSKMPWYGCDAGAPSLSTVHVAINGQGTLATSWKLHDWSCGGGGEGNIYFAPDKFGCQ